MPIRKTRAVVVAVGGCIAFWAQMQPAGADVLRMGGTGTATELLRALGAAFSKQSAVDVDVVPSLGSTGAIRGVADGVLNIAVSGRPLKDAEAAKGLSTPLTARTAFVFATSHPNPNPLQSSQIARIFASNATWSDGSAVRIILRPKSESDTALLGELFPPLAPAIEAARLRADIPVAATDQDNADLAEQTPGSLIGSTLAQIANEKRRLRMITLDGVEPTFENFDNGSYPYVKTLHFVLRTTTDPLAERFMVFLHSPEGQNAFRSAHVKL